MKAVVVRNSAAITSLGLLIWGGTLLSPSPPDSPSSSLAAGLILAAIGLLIVAVWAGLKVNRENTGHRS